MRIGLSDLCVRFVFALFFFALAFVFRGSDFCFQLVIALVRAFFHGQFRLHPKYLIVAFFQLQSVKIGNFGGNKIPVLRCTNVPGLPCETTFV